MGIKYEDLHIYWSLQQILAMPNCWQRYSENCLPYQILSMLMGSSAQGTNYHPWQVHAYYERFILQYVGLWHSSVSWWYPCVLLYSEETALVTRKYSGMLTSVYVFWYKLNKYSFLCNSTKFIGFNIIPKGMHISDSKVWSLNERLVPTIVKQLFLSFVKYF